MLLREKWAENANKALLQAFGDNAPQIDHRSYQEQGIEKEPTKHLGYEQKKWRYKMRDEEEGKNRNFRAYI